MIIQQASNQLEVDPFNERILGFIVEPSEETYTRLTELQATNQPAKIIIFTKEEHVDCFLREDFQLEGKMDGFFNGANALILTKYFTEARATSQSEEQNAEVMKVVHDDTKGHTQFEQPAGLVIAQAGAEDTEGLAQLYRKVFQSYPTNVFDPHYLQSEMGPEYPFVIMKDGDRIISAASAFIRSDYNCAEITDCVTDPDYLGRSLLAPIVIKLEELLLQKGVHCVYSLTRSQSYGMNLTVKRLGYRCQGTLINNCNIYSGYEDMNIWTKQLVPYA